MSQIDQFREIKNAYFHHCANLRLVTVGNKKLEEIDEIKY